MTENLAFWNRMAKRYAERPVRDAAAYDAMLEDLAQRLSPEDRVLEIGCGTGTTALRFGGRVAEWRATDGAPEMIRIAAAKPRVPGVTFTVADVGHAFDAAPHDAICAFHILHLVPEMERTLTHIHAALKPGGLFISKTWCFAEMSWRFRLLMPLLRLFGLFPPVRKLRAESLRQAIRAAGFVIEADLRFGSSSAAPYIVARKPASGPIHS